MSFLLVYLRLSKFNLNKINDEKRKKHSISILGSGYTIFL